LRHTGEIATGARRRGRQERRGRNFDPEEATPGVVARRVWVAPWGNKPRESRWRRRTAPRSIGSHSEAGRKSEGGTRAIHLVRARRAKTTRWTNHGVGSPNRYGGNTPGSLRGNSQPQERRAAARRRTDASSIGSQALGRATIVKPLNALDVESLLFLHVVVWLMCSSMTNTTFFMLLVA
jgi:hypothetical protein